MNPRANNCKILIVSPPLSRIRFNLSGIMPMQPLGIAALAGYLRKKGLDVELLDSVALRHTTDQTLWEILKRSPQIVGFSTTIFNIAHTHVIIRRLKEIRPEIKTVMGGYGVVFPSEMLGSKLEEIDFFIRGEGEEAFWKLVCAIQGKADVEEVPGLIWRENGRVRQNPPSPPLDPNSLPLPALDLLPKAPYSMHPPFNIKPPLCLVETARGCGWQCNFCSLSRDLRQKSVERVREEIAWAKRIFKAREVHFVDPTFTAGRKRLFELTAMIKKDFPGLAWSCKSRVDLMDYEAARRMAGAGCHIVSLGMESGSQKMLNAMNKAVTVEQSVRAVRALKKAGVRSLVYIMFGAPGETDQTVRQTMDLLERIRPDYALFAGLMPDPLSALLRRKSSEGVLSQEDVFNFYYNNSAAGTPLENDSFTEIPMADINRWVKDAYTSFYVNPRYMASRLFASKSLREIKNLAHGAIMLAKDALFPPGP
ncbi:B12-binding domain-containing radical SAM protein [Desulfatibacillum aliphaticivorans]|uniref:B12-binding domain-containing radical SAM protein n=1 Tax=Desulfatibacillum aliphaticivorans TaxID=218208 RepID=UPI0003FE6F32|nr:radical SAM protein [Desulfatibacillum aliphaticivorans]